MACVFPKDINVTTRRASRPKTVNLELADDSFILTLSEEEDAMDTADTPVLVIRAKNRSDPPLGPGKRYLVS